jgi:hypothetical protein
MTQTLTAACSPRRKQLSSAQRVATSVYSALGFVKYGREIAAVLAQNNIARTFATRAGLTVSQLDNLATLSQNRSSK